MSDEIPDQPKAEGPFCSACGKQILKTTEICPHCGSRVKESVNDEKRGHYPRTKDGRIVSGEKSMVLAIILSIIIPGTGTMYNGKVGRGFVILIASVLLSIIIVGVIIWIYGIYDAYKLTKENNVLWYEYNENRY